MSFVCTMARVKVQERIADIKSLVEIFCNLDDTQRAVLLKYLSDDGINAVSECVYNAMTNQTLDEKEAGKLRVKLARDKRRLRFISRPSADNVQKRRKMMIQSGGSLPFLISTLIPLLASVISNSRS